MLCLRIMTSVFLAMRTELLKVKEKINRLLSKVNLGNSFQSELGLGFFIGLDSS